MKRVISLRPWRTLLGATGNKKVGLGSRLLVALVVGASLAALVYGLAKNWPQLVGYRWELTYWPIPIALLLYGVALGLAVVVWGGIVRRMGGRSRWMQDLRIYCASSLAKRLPTPLWFLLGRVYLYEELGVSKAISSLATVMEGVLVLFSGLVTLLALVPFGGGLALLQRYTGLIAGLAVVCLLLLLRPQSLRWTLNWLARRLGRGQAVAEDVDYRHMLLWIGFYSLVWITGGVILFLLLRTIYVLPARDLPAVVAAWVTGGVVSHVALFLPGGLGLKELTMAALLSAVVPMPIAILVSIVARVWFSLNELIWLIISSRLVSVYARHKPKLDVPIPAPDQRPQ